MENKKMTIFYKKRNLEIDSLCSGVQSLIFYEGDIEDNELIYDFIIVDYDNFILRNNKEFYLEKNEAGEIQIKITPEFQESLKKYL